MTDKFDNSELQDIKRRIIAARSNGVHEPKGNITRGSSGLGFRLCIDFVAGVIMGAAIGKFVDSLLSTEPLFLVSLLLVGGAAGMLNVYRSVKQIEKDRKDAAKE